MSSDQLAEVFAAPCMSSTREVDVADVECLRRSSTAVLQSISLETVAWVLGAAMSLNKVA